MIPRRPAGGIHHHTIMSFQTPGMLSAPKPDRDSSEVEIQLNQLEGAAAVLRSMRDEFAMRLQEGGVLIPPTPEPDGKLCTETATNSPLGERIRCVRAELTGIADDFGRLLGRLAI